MIYLHHSNDIAQSKDNQFSSSFVIENWKIIFPIWQFCHFISYTSNVSANHFYLLPQNSLLNEKDILLNVRGLHKKGKIGRPKKAQFDN